MDQWFDARPASVSKSRRFAEEATADLAPEFREAIVLMVSELATNALVHATSGFEVRIERDATAVRTTVTDNGDGSPSLSFPDSTEPHGRGLLVVQELSDDWGTTVDPDTPGKAVWFTLDVTRGVSGESGESTG
jgi:two-component sensor histidine kinase